MAVPITGRVRSQPAAGSLPPGENIRSDTPIDYDEDTVANANIKGKVTIKAINLIQKNGNVVSLNDVYSHIVFFEDLYSSCVSGYVSVNDAAGGMEKFYISGGEKIEVNIVKANNGETLIKRSDFVVYRVTGGEITDTLNTKYSLLFVSEHYVNSTKKKIFKSYYTKANKEVAKINDIAKAIYSEVSTKSLSTEESLDIAIPKPFVCTGLTPIEALQKLADRVCTYGKYYTIFERLIPVSKTTAAGLRVNDTTFFCSVESLRQTGDNAYKIVYSPRVTSGSTVTETIPDGTIRASQLIRMNNFNHMDYMMSGIYNSRITTLNHISRNYFVKNISHVSDTLPETILPERDFYKNKIIDTNSNNPFSQYNNINEYPGERLVPITVNDLVPKEKWIDKSSLGHMMSSLYRVQVLIDGSTNKLSCGDSVNLSVPSKFRKNLSGDPQVLNDEMLSGYYLVTSVKHAIVNNGVYSKRVELGRGTLPVDLDNKFSLNNGTTPQRQSTFVSTVPPSSFNEVQARQAPGTIDTRTNTYDGLKLFATESIPPSAGVQLAQSTPLRQEISQNKQTDTTETRTRDYSALEYRGNVDESGWWDNATILNP